MLKTDLDLRRPLLSPRALAVATLLTLSATAAEAGNLKIVLVSAVVNPKKLKVAGPPRNDVPYSDLACLALPGLRSIADSCGVHMADDGVTMVPNKPLPEKAPIDPLLRLEIDDHVIRTYPVPSTLKPQWEYGALVDEALLAGGGTATLILNDFVSAGHEEELGRAKVPFNDLLKPGKHTANVGPAVVTYTVEKLAENASRHYHYSVPADKQIADLAREAGTTQKGDSYVAVPVAEGEVVEVRAQGTVQPNVKKHPDRTAGPNGIATISTKIQFNQPGFRDGQNHAALIGQLGTKSMMIGERRKMTADTAGFLILAINDLKTADNAGAFDVEVDIYAPEPSSPPPMKKRGSAADSGPAGLDPRVVQQIIDSHTNDLLSCATAGPNGSGDIVLQFMIAADGQGVVSVADASPNLKDTASCMAQKAGGWKFPPPRGAAVVRYPLHLDAD